MFGMEGDLSLPSYFPIYVYACVACAGFGCCFGRAATLL